MASPLYNRDILRLAASLAEWKRLEHPHASADRRSPTCGSRMIVDVRVDQQGRIEAIGLDARACALGQASAALLARSGLGRTAADMEEATQALRAFLQSDAEAADTGFWPGIELLSPARAYPARHPSILLSFEAASEAAVNAVREAQAS